MKQINNVVGLFLQVSNDVHSGIIYPLHLHGTLETWLPVLQAIMLRREARILKGWTLLLLKRNL